MRTVNSLSCVVFTLRRFVYFVFSRMTCHDRRVFYTVDVWIHARPFASIEFTRICFHDDAEPALSGLRGRYELVEGLEVHEAHSMLQHVSGSIWVKDSLHCFRLQYQESPCRIDALLHLWLVLRLRRYTSFDERDALLPMSLALVAGLIRDSTAVHTCFLVVWQPAKQHKHVHGFTTPKAGGDAWVYAVFW